MLGSILTGCLSADGSSNPGRENHLIRYNHANDDSSRSILKKYFLSHPVRDDIDAQPVHKGICLDAAIDGKHKPYICPARVVLEDGTPTDEVILQIFVTDCITRQLDCYARKDDGIVYRIKISRNNSVNWKAVHWKSSQITDITWIMTKQSSRLLILLGPKRNSNESNQWL